MPRKSTKTAHARKAASVRPPKPHPEFPLYPHADDSMAATYRERIDDERLQAVAAHVRAWLFGDAPRSGPGNSTGRQTCDPSDAAPKNKGKTLAAKSKAGRKRLQTRGAKNAVAAPANAVKTGAGPQGSQNSAPISNGDEPPRLRLYVG